jgi:hypothetical protein
LIVHRRRSLMHGSLANKHGQSFAASPRIRRSITHLACTERACTLTSTTQPWTRLGWE